MHFQLEVECPALATTSPAIAHIFDSYPRNDDTNLRRKVSRPFGKALRALVREILFKGLTRCHRAAGFNYRSTQTKTAVF